MSNPAVVILTDPAHCQLAEAETLVQALLQVQQLNKAGVPASQAFCDHPAAAMEFIEAYSKAYPALQQETSELPLPQHLYSMVADGRLSPLRPIEAPETTKLEQTGQAHPLYVLSLGAPEALIQALQYNQLANGSIRVLEIAPVEQAKAEPVSVAEAVAAVPLPRSSWSSEGSRAPEWRDEDAPGTEQLTDNPVKLSSVEVDLDRIQADSAKVRQVYDQSDQVHTAPGIIPATADPDAGSSSVGRQTAAEAPASSIGIPEPASQQAGVATSAAEVVSDARHGLPTESSGTSITQSDVMLAAINTPAGDGADTHDEPDQGNTGPSESPVDEPDERNLMAGGEGHPGPAPAAAEPDFDDAATTGVSLPDDDGGDPLAPRSSAFAEPGEDIHYQPTASFSGDGDLLYALPTDGAGEPGFLPALFDLAQGAEVVDPEAIYRDLSEPSAEGGTALKALDVIVMRAPDPTPADPNDGTCAYLEGDASVPQEDPGPDGDETLHDALTTVHDADV